MEQPEKTALDALMTWMLHMFGSMVRLHRGEAVALIYSIEEEPRIAVSLTFDETEQRIISQNVLPAIVAAARQIEELRKSKLM